MTLSVVPIINLPSLYVNLISVTNNATTPNTKIDVGYGICRDQTNTFDLNIGNYNDAIAALSANTTTTIDAATNGINGLDTGTLAASRVYAVYVVADIQGANTTGAVVSRAAPSVGPTMPVGYSAYRLVGYMVTDASAHFLPMYTAGTGSNRLAMFDAPQATSITAGNATSYTAIDLSTLVPAVDNLPVYINSAFTPGAASRVLNLQSSGATGDQIVITGQVNAVVNSNQSMIVAKLVSSAPKVSYKVSNAGDAAAINVAGFAYYL